MSLDNIQLPAITIQQLYKYSLIVPKTEEEKNAPGSPVTVKFLGGNRRGIILLVDNSEATWLPELQLDFLLGILTACSLTMDDIALINISKSGPSNYKELLGNLNPKTILLFGNSFSSIELPFKIPEFQVQSFDGSTYLSIPSIPLLQDSKELKRKLWICLKQIFSL